jgi:hypothetical protein
MKSGSLIILECQVKLSKGLKHVSLNIPEDRSPIRLDRNCMTHFYTYEILSLREPFQTLLIQ